MVRKINYRKDFNEILKFSHQKNKVGQISFKIPKIIKLNTDKKIIKFANSHTRKIILYLKFNI